MAHPPVQSTPLRRPARRLIALAALTALGHASHSRAASWDPIPGPPGVLDGGPGNWDLFTPNWSVDGGASNQPWVNGDPANFGGAAGGTVTLGSGGVTAGSLTFDPTLSLSTYTIAGLSTADVLTLAGPLVTANQDATISATLGGSAGLTKAGNSTLTLAGTNTFTGPIAITAGKLSVSSAANLGAATSINVGAATLEATASLTYGGGLALGLGGATIAVTPAGAVLTIAGPIIPAGGVNVIKTGAGTLTLGSAANPLVAFGGQVYFATDGTLRLGDSAAGSTVAVNQGAVILASGAGVVELSGRAASPGVGTSIAGDVYATAGGRVDIGSATDDTAQIAFAPTSTLSANSGGTIVLRPRIVPLTLDAGTVGSLSVGSGGVLSAAGTADLVLARDVNESGAWTLANEGPATFRIVAAAQDTTAGLTLRAQAGVTRYEADTIKLGLAAANGTLNVEPRGGTIDLRNDAPGKTFTYEGGYTVSGWGQLGTVAANQTHVIPAAGGVTFYANQPGAAGGTLNVVGAFDETAGTKAAFRVGDNDGLMLTVPNAAAAPYVVAGVTVDAQSPGGVARFAVAGGAVQANSFSAATNNALRLDVQAGGTLTTNLSGTGSLLVTGPGSTPVTVAGGGTFVTTSPTFTLNANETIGGTGTLFGLTGATPTALTLNGTVDLNGTLGGSIAAASGGTLRLDAGETLTLAAAADLNTMALAYAGASTAAAALEVNAPAAVVRLRTTATVGAFAGAREFKATAGTLQVDAADAATVTITGVNQLAVDRTPNGVADGGLLGTLTLVGGAFQVGTTASTNTVSAGALLVGQGTFGHATAIDSVVNNGTIRAAAGQLNVIGAEVKGSGTWDPNGQVILVTGAVKDVGAGSPTVLRVSGTSGGRVQVGGLANTYTGGTVIDGTGGAAPVILRVTSSNSLGAGSITLTNGTLQMFSDFNVNHPGSAVLVTGTSLSTIGFDRNTGAGGRTHTLGVVTIDGSPLFLQGNGNSVTLTLGGVSVTTNGASITNTGGSNVNLGPVTAAGNLSLQLGSINMTVGPLSGAGNVTRNASSGTLNLNRPAGAYTGLFTTAVGTTTLTAANVFSPAPAAGAPNRPNAYLFTNNGTVNGTVNINAGGTGALAGGDGAQTGGTLNLNVAGALNGTTLNYLNGTASASVASALGTGTVILGAGRLTLKNDAGTAFGGTITVAGGTNAGLLLVDRNGAGTGGTHSINALNLVDRQLNLTGGTNGTGWGLLVGGPTTVGGVASSRLNNDAAGLTLSSLVLGAPLTIGGGGPTTIGQLAGTAALTQASTGTTYVTGAPAAGFASAVEVQAGALNLDAVPGALAGGSVLVNGGTLNLGTAGALAGTPVTLASGFLAANVPDALAGVTLPVTNGSLRAAANNALGNATVNLTGGNVTATAPGALGSSTINTTGAVIALRADASAAFGGTVNVLGTGFSTISVANLTDEGGAPASVMSINALNFGGQTLNVTGANDDVFAVVNPIAMSGTGATTVNATAADAIFQGALTGANPLVKSGGRALTLDGGGNFGVTTVRAGTLVVNNAWTTPGVTVGGTNGAATLQLGGGGVNAPGNLVINAGTLRIAKVNPADAVPLASAVTGGLNGNVTVEYAAPGAAGTLANNVTIDTTGGPRTLTLSAASGTAAGQVSTFTYAGLVVRSGTNALAVVARADTELDDGFGNLQRPPSRLVLAGNQTFATDLAHGGGIVIGKGVIPAGTTASPFGTSTNALQLTLTDSTVGGTVADGAASATFGKSVVTASANASRMRLGAFYNPAGAAGTQTIAVNASFAWNDASFPLNVAGTPAVAAAVSGWNGLFADPGTVLQLNAGAGGAVLDNVIAASGTNVTAVSPIFVGGGGTVRFEAGFDDAAYRNLAVAKGLAGTVTVLDNTTLASNTTGHHFDAVELRTGSYQVGGAAAQTLANGFFVNPSSFDPAGRTTSGVVTDVNLNLTGLGAAKAFKIAAGQTLAKSGTATVNISGDQSHGAGATLAVNQGTVNVNTDAGMAPGGGNPANNLSVVVANGAVVNFAVTQHVAQLTVNSGLVKLAAGPTAGARWVEATGVSAAGGQVDLTNGRLIVDYAAGGSSPIASVRQMVVGGYNAAGARWAGNGITSSTAAADITVAFGLGYGEAADVIGLSGGAFGGETVDSSAVLVRYTKLGDANLDAVVDFNDLVRLAQNYNTGGGAATWAQGDFTYDGVVDFNDLIKLAQNYNTALPSGAVPGAAVSFEGDWAAAMSGQVPEPGVMAIVGAALGAGALMRRRRRGMVT